MLGGMKVVQGLEYVQQSEERLFPESRHRSQRVHKKLVRRFGGEFRMVPATFQYGDTLFMHPAHYQALREQTKHRERLNDD